MTTSQQQPRAMPSGHRHHPYASSSTHTNPPTNRKWTTGPVRGRSTERPEVQSLPSPPRSNRDHSATHPAGLGAAFGGREGGKWWDEELVRVFTYQSLVSLLISLASTTCKLIIHPRLFPPFGRRRPGPPPSYPWRKEGRRRTSHIPHPNPPYHPSSPSICSRSSRTHPFSRGTHLLSTRHSIKPDD